MKVNEHLKNSLKLAFFSPFILVVMVVMALGTFMRGVSLMLAGVVCPKLYEDAEEEFKRILP